MRTDDPAYPSGVSQSFGGMVEARPTPTSPDEPPRGRAFAVVATILVLLLVVGVLAYGGVWLLRTYQLQGDPDYPDHWDARVEPFVKVVEKQRGLEFRHPVNVDFLDVKAFQKALASHAADLSGEDQVDPEQATGMLRAVGLLEGDLDLTALQGRLQRVGTLGYYSFEDERIRVRGTKLTPAVRSTLVHELTHALQDQHFDLGTRMELLSRQDDGTAAQAFDAVVEGDATRIEHAWASGLSKKKSAALKRSKAAQMRKYKSQTGGIPRVLEAFVGAPYALGESLVALVARRTGQHDVDQMFTRPPRTDEHLVDWWTYLNNPDQPRAVPAPKLRKGEKEFDSGTFGATGWLLMLAERLPTERALDAVDGWGGDSYVGFTRDDVSCIRVNYRGDTPQDTAEMSSALRAWVAALPHGPASAHVTGKTVAFESCDPGTKTSVGRDASIAALRLVVARAAVAAEFISEGPAFARCVSDRLVRRFTLAQLSDPQQAPAAIPVVASCR